MQIMHMSADEALERLRLTNPSVRTELPRFVAAPTPVMTRNAAGGDVSIIFNCYDHANDTSQMVEIPYGQPPRTGIENERRLAECAARAIEVAYREATAVFN